jgi:hypothetical protein
LICELLHTTYTLLEADTVVCRELGHRQSNVLEANAQGTKLREEHMLSMLSGHTQRLDALERTLHGLSASRCHNVQDPQQISIKLATMQQNSTELVDANMY